MLFNAATLETAAKIAHHPPDFGCAGPGQADPYANVIHMPALDTTPDAAAVQEAAYRRLGRTGRLRIALELSNLVHALAETGIRKRHPEYTAE
jgi:hypothetical protein